MSSVVSFEDCPICGSVEALYEDYNIRTQEIFRTCNCCGYHLTVTLQRDENGKALQPLQYDEEERFGAGVINIEYKGQAAIECVGVPTGTSKDEVLSKITEIEKDDRVKQVTATWFDEENKKIEILRE